MVLPAVPSAIRHLWTGPRFAYLGEMWVILSLSLSKLYESWKRTVCRAPLYHPLGDVGADQCTLRCKVGLQLCHRLDKIAGWRSQWPLCCDDAPVATPRKPDAAVAPREFRQPET